MKNRKCDWCYFTDGSKKKITNWYQPDEDILFFINGKLYLYKEDNFRHEEPPIRLRQKLILPVKPRGMFYTHCHPTLHYPSGEINKDNEDEWVPTNIEKIELRVR